MRIHCAQVVLFLSFTLNVNATPGKRTPILSKSTEYLAPVEQAYFEGIMLEFAAICSQ
jgi:hypothetical protein